MDYTEWTRQVKAAVGQVVERHGYVWIATSPKTSAWLWDGVAQSRDSAGNLLTVPVALECEWMGEAEIKKDFEKLVVSRAELRVMVCSAVSLRGVKGHFDRLHTMIDAFRFSQCGDRYLFAGWYGKPKTPRQLVFESHVVQR